MSWQRFIKDRMEILFFTFTISTLIKTLYLMIWD